MDIESFKNMASAIQSLVIAISILVGGGWALYRFLSLQAIEKARVELEKIKRELQQRGTLDIDMEVIPIGSFSGLGKYISVTLNLTNIGNRPEFVKWKDSVVCATIINRDEKGIPQMSSTIEGYYLSPLIQLEGSRIDPGSIGKYPFIIPIPEAGIYLIDSFVVGSPEESNLTKTLAISAGVSTETLAWRTSKYIEILEDQQMPSKKIQPTQKARD